MSWIRGALVLGAFGLLTWLERRRPLRARTEPLGAHLARNLVIAGLAGLTVSTTEAPLVRPCTRWRSGLLHRLPLPPWGRDLAAMVLMDYTLYWWHVWVHRVPLLWRFHLPHHVDADMDASTALRFHFGELILSVPYRMAQIALIGVTPRAFRAWQTLTTLGILFHHSNVRLPLALERRLWWIVVTPRLHGIHHSTVRAETDSNWSSGLAVWDWLHGTRRTDVPQPEIVIGVPAWPRARLVEALAMPFGPQRDDWAALDSGNTNPWTPSVPYRPQES